MKRLNIVEVGIKTEKIALDQFLKWAQVVSTGGEAKALIQEGLVLVNGAVEERRGRRLQPGDQVVVEGRGGYRVITHEG